MAKGSKSKRRDNNSIANRRLPFESDYRPTPFDQERQLRFDWGLDVEDRRQWHPEGPQRPARTRSGQRHRLRLAKPSRARQAPARRFNPWSSLSAGVAFGDAPRVMVCQRRSRRRQVLHALRKTGKRGQRRPRYSWYSKIRCKG